MPMKSWKLQPLKELLFFLCLKMIAIQFILGSTTPMCKHTKDDKHGNRGPHGSINILREYWLWSLSWGEGGVRLFDLELVGHK